jgi:hypothetical protein
MHTVPKRIHEKYLLGPKTRFAKISVSHKGDRKAKTKKSFSIEAGKQAKENLHSTLDYFFDSTVGIASL